ncbi:LLM class flavin-dependent oxidoreductase [Actinomadura graeca]|uniref:LLM class flavin-dependent oxidoreductase n=1 Tax=Actinomadura graeca TaxID=2750812 RepID=A0ABX8QZF7_9ACTN|nr:LLM class flavin-dependent oxidoreductase [Actinomadura graeca]QXJ23107.1 LLM class flavin-dependent oxidoreductase [Actinomadura graeca]
MRFSINIPNFGDFADAKTVAAVAEAAERTGWDALFVWDHVVHVKSQRRAFGDPWMLLTAAALATKRIKLGTLVTPVARRRPQQLARQVATLDAISGGRVIFGAGLGGPVEDEYGSFGEPTDNVVLAERLDEGLDLLARYWTGEPVTHKGSHYQVDDVALLPPTVQHPRPPVWVAGYWPNKAPMRRAARWDGAVPLFGHESGRRPPSPGEVRELTDFVTGQRDGRDGFDIVVGGVSRPSDGPDLLASLADAGATWWDERQPANGLGKDRLAPVLRRIEQGPPLL